MANFGLNDVENYGGTGGNYFKLENNGDSAIVRFMYNSLDDVQGYAVHRIDLPNKQFKTINCLREYTDPLENCPLCANRNFQQAKFYFNLYDMKADEVKVWERGKKILNALLPVLQQISGPICGTPIKITRRGEAGDYNTKYDFELMEPDGCTLDDLPDGVDPNENIITSYSFNELSDYVKTGKLPGDTSVTNTTQEQTSIKRRYSYNNDNRGGNNNTVY